MEGLSLKEILAAIVAGVSLVTPAAAWLIGFYSKKQTEIETLKAGNTRAALNRLDDDVKDFRSSVSGIQANIKDLSASLIQNRSDVALLKERLDDTKKLLERYEKSHDEKVKNLIKTEITELTKQIMLIRTKKV